MKRIVILGAAGQISRKLTAALLQRTDADLVLFGRRLRERLSLPEKERIRIVEGDFSDKAALKEAIQGADIVYLNAMENLAHTQSIIDVMQNLNVLRLIGASMAGIENEVSESLTNWSKDNLPWSYIQEELASAAAVKASKLDYTLLRLTWLYDQEGQTSYELVPSGQEFKDAEVSCEAVAEAIMEIIEDTSDRFSHATFGLGQPGTHYDKPSFL